MMDFDLVPAGGFPKRCDFIYAQVTDYSRQQGFTLHMAGLTKKLLGRATAAEYPTATLGCIIISIGDLKQTETILNHSLTLRS